MSKAIITEQHLHDIADAIIAKGGATGPLKPSEMAAAVAAIPSGGGPDPYRQNPHWNPPEQWPNIRRILAEDDPVADGLTTTTYPYKCAVMINDVCDVCELYGGMAYRTSDGQFFEHASQVKQSVTWDRDQDIETGLGYNVRWAIIYNTEANREFIEGGRGFKVPNEQDAGDANNRIAMWVYFPDNVVPHIYDHIVSGRYAIVAYECSDNTVGGYGVSFQSGSIVYSGIRANNYINCQQLEYCERLNTDLSCSQMFSGCTSLRGLGFDEMTVQGSAWRLFLNCYALSHLPDTMIFEVATDDNTTFSGCHSVWSMPRHVTSVGNLDFSGLTRLTDKQSVVDFANNLNTVDTNSTIVLHANTKSMFTAAEWSDIAATLAAKNWNLSPA